MQIVLTHEQADFDAVASLLAASLLNPEAIPVLPRRLNRNVRAYLTLYGDRLPYIEFEDLQRKPLDNVILVDTQTMVSVKGFSDETPVHVVDHHPKSLELDPSWSYHISDTGATVSILVEDIQELGLDLDLITATLLLLGIYEDTGSLTYGGTTPRDVRASAWLLDQGASLKIAGDFLNHPLSTEQRALYDRLIESTETHRFHGLTIVIASAVAKGFMDEISTLAHKLRDLYDPSGLFVLVALNEHVQMVARSTADELDVSLVATHFGGGGHSRAAAALIRGGSIDEIKTELLTILPTIIQPEKRVGEIMSRDPQLLSPDVTVAEAAESMRRFGHEGFPVIDNGNVIGLLTRRAVDRAMSHGMGTMAISSVMDAGNLVVSPTDSVQYLQRVMIENDWGQVPVADPTSGVIVGIVTRTDLLKTLAGIESKLDETNLADRLEDALSPAVLGLLKLVARQVETQNAALYIVGGFVRDLLLGEPSVDFDLVVEGDAIELARALASRYGGRMSSHRRFGTAKWMVDPRNEELSRALGRECAETGEIPTSLDLVSARTEFYHHPTALPSVQRGSIKLDLHRRDFSINTLATRLDGRHYGELLDHWGGERDLREGLIRVLHSLSFVDDPTRVLRAIRLEQRLGFSIEPRTLELLQGALPLLDRVSGERIRHELEAVFREDRRIEIMRRLNGLNLLSTIHPVLSWDESFEDAFREVPDYLPPSEWKIDIIPQRAITYYGLWLLKMTERDARSVCKRLSFSTLMRNIVLDANRLARELPSLCAEALPSTLVDLMDELRIEAIQVAWLGLKDEPDCRVAIEQYLSQWRFVQPHTTGDDLRALHLPPGPSYRVILRSLRGAWLDGLIQSAKEEEDLLQKMVEEARSSG